MVFLVFHLFSTSAAGLLAPWCHKMEPERCLCAQSYNRPMSLILLMFTFSVSLKCHNCLILRLHDDSHSVFTVFELFDATWKAAALSPHTLATASKAHLCSSATTGASSMLHGALHQSLLEQLEAIRVIRGAASPLDDDKCQEKRSTPSGHFEVPFCCPAMFS